MYQNECRRNILRIDSFYFSNGHGRNLIYLHELSQQTNTCSESTIETLNYVQS